MQTHPYGLKFGGVYLPCLWLYQARYQYIKNESLVGFIYLVCDFTRPDTNTSRMKVWWGLPPLSVTLPNQIPIHQGWKSGGVYLPCMASESSRRWLRSLLLCPCNVFRTPIVVVFEGIKQSRYNDIISDLAFHLIFHHFSLFNCC